MHRSSLRLLVTVPVLALTAFIAPTSAVAAPQLTVTPARVGVGAPVAVTGSGFPVPRVAVAGCLLTEDGTQVGRCSPTPKGGISGSFAAVGDPGPHTITATYGTSSATATLVVVVGSTVPDLPGLSGREALNAIKQADLAACVPVEPDWVVVSQSLAAGSVVPPGTCVGPVLAPAPTATDRPVPVPDVVRSTAKAAQATLAAVGLSSTLTGGGGRVVDQDPDAGTLVARGTSVRLRTAALPLLVVVPDVTGGDVGAARARLGAVGLAVDGSPADDARITGQAPAAGARVAPGTVVVLELEPAGSTSSAGGSGVHRWLPLGAAAAVLLAALAVLAAAVRRQRVRPAREASVPQLRAYDDLSLNVAVQPTSEAVGLPLRLVPVPDTDPLLVLLEVR